MCGRFVSPSDQAIADYWGIELPDGDELQAARFNVAPQQGNPDNYIPVVRENAQGKLERVRMQWWLLPAWSKERTIKASTFNARIERVREAAAFRESLSMQRCIIPAKGWYEWQELRSGNVPWYLHGVREEMLSFAGLWARWSDGGEVIESCAVIVGPANNKFWSIHDRMPYVLPRERARAWMSRQLTDPEAALALLTTNPEDSIQWHRVSRRINRAAPDNQGADLILPIDPDSEAESTPDATKKVAAKRTPARKPQDSSQQDLFGDEPPF